MSARTVLLIDTDMAWCEHVCLFLAAHGIESLAVATEEAALQLLGRSARPGAIIVDPAHVDRAFITLLSELPGLSGVPLYYMSSLSAASVYMRGARATGYVRKEVALDHLIFLLDDVRARATSDNSSLMPA